MDFSTLDAMTAVSELFAVHVLVAGEGELVEVYDRAGPPEPLVTLTPPEACALMAQMYELGAYAEPFLTRLGRAASEAVYAETARNRAVGGWAA